MTQRPTLCFWTRWLGGAFVLICGGSVGCQKMGLGAGDAKSKSEISKKDKDKELPPVEDRPATPKTMYAYARILFAQGQDANCDILLSKLIAEHPRFKPAYILQAQARMRMRHFDDAIASLYSALRWAPKDHVILNDLGICFLMKSDAHNALSGFTAAAARQPANGRYRANMAIALALMGRDEESMSLYAMVLPPTDAQHNLSVVSSARGAFFGSGESAPILTSDSLPKPEQTLNQPPAAPPPVIDNAGRRE